MIVARTAAVKAMLVKVQGGKQRGGEGGGGTTHTKSVFLRFEERSRARDADGMYVSLDREQAGAVRVFSTPRRQAPAGDDGCAARAIALAVSRRCVAMFLPWNAPCGSVARSRESMTCVIAAV